MAKMADLSVEPSPASRPAVGLWWDGRDENSRVVQRADSVWGREPASPNVAYRGLTSFHWRGDQADPAALVIAGDRVAALEYLARTAPGYFALVHVELPRTVLDDK